ncbi:MIZ zinc finger protein [Nannizzia gypsea CBS 118893]|uniref:MIZ zinc finger protein n=1 Tax=Arthroderma gypseum (strain ATCC MYA-4604 / CBS 118893) TaxID=535722 RepID=E4UNW8_ARTGP|nr:MIZ zinc finger protein [Nannizzia gypsea CBS 118893]EFQ99721.1 MIZ zinc finger protein [Nannizzia gypsea CBS 118893]
MISPNSRKQPTSSIRQQANDSELVASNSTASRFLGSRPKAWMQNKNLPGPAPTITRRPSRPLHTTNKTRAVPKIGPKDTPYPSEKGPGKGNIPASKEPKDAAPTQCLSPVSSPMLPPAIRITPDPIIPDSVQQAQQAQQSAPSEKTVEQPTQPLPSPNPSHRSHPTGNTPGADPVTADIGVSTAPDLPAEEHHAASSWPSPSSMIPPQQSSQAPQTTKGSPQAGRSTVRQMHPLVEVAQRSGQDGGDQDKHQNKRPRLTSFQPPTATSVSATPISPITSTTTTPRPIINTLVTTTTAATTSALYAPLSPQLPSLIPLSPGTGVNPPGSSASPLQQPPTDLSPQALNSCAEFLSSIIPTFQPSEATFIYMLRDACVGYDLQYLALHQLYCLSVKSSGLLPDIGEHAMRGITTVTGLICPSTKLSSAYIEYFSSFPSDFSALVPQNRPYAAAVEAVKGWAASLITTWPGFFSKVISRGYPPLLDEIITSLGVLSSVMHGIFYSRCVSTLVANRAPGLREAWRVILKKNIEFYRNRLKKANTSNPVPEVQTQGENKYLVMMYQRIGEKHPPRGTSLPVTQPVVPQHTVFHQQPRYNSLPMSQPLRSNHSLPPRPAPPRPIPVLTTGQQQHMRFPGTATSIPQASAFQPRQPIFQSQPPAVVPSVAAAASMATRQAYTPATHQLVTPSTATYNQINSYHLPSYQAYPTPSIQPPLQAIPQLTGTPLFPPRGANALPPANPSPSASHHLAHLRVANVSMSKPESQEPGENLFHSFESFAIPPTSLDWNQCNFQIPFTLSQSQYTTLPRPLHLPNTCHITQGVFDGCKAYQVKCIRLTNTLSLTEEKWMAAECSWPTAIYIHINGQEHFFRRKFHFGKDLPVPISRALRQGTNEIKISLIGTPEERRKYTFAIAVEVVNVASHKRTREAVQTLSQPQSLDIILNRLTNNTVDSDELCFVDDFIAIPLIDPFMARIFNIPVRTVTCKHTECFDLDTFFDTRLSRVAKGPHGMAEDWKCPICNEDARPKRLLIDQFLVQVRKELAERKQLDDVTSIKVRADKSWDIITRQSGTGKAVGGSSLRADEEVTATTVSISASPRAAQAPPEIIEID